MMSPVFHHTLRLETEGCPRPRVGVKPPPRGSVGGSPAMPGGTIAHEVRT